MCSIGLIEFEETRSRRVRVMAFTACLALLATPVQALAGPAGIRGSDLAAVAERPVDLEEQQRLHDVQRVERRRALRDRYLSGVAATSPAVRRGHRPAEVPSAPRSNAFRGGPLP